MRAHSQCVVEHLYNIYWRTCFEYPVDIITSVEEITYLRVSFLPWRGDGDDELEDSTLQSIAI